MIKHLPAPGWPIPRLLGLAGDVLWLVFGLMQCSEGKGELRFEVCSGGGMLMDVFCVIKEREVV